LFKGKKWTPFHSETKHFHNASQQEDSSENILLVQATGVLPLLSSFHCSILYGNLFYMLICESSLKEAYVQWFFIPALHTSILVLRNTIF